MPAKKAPTRAEPDEAPVFVAISHPTSPGAVGHIPSTVVGEWLARGWVLADEEPAGAAGTDVPAE